MTTLELLQCLFYATGSFFFLGLLTAAMLNVYIGYRFWLNQGWRTSVLHPFFMLQGSRLASLPRSLPPKPMNSRSLVIIQLVARFALLAREQQGTNMCRYYYHTTIISLLMDRRCSANCLGPGTNVCWPVPAVPRVYHVHHDLLVQVSALCLLA